MKNICPHKFIMHMNITFTKCICIHKHEKNNTWINNHSYIQMHKYPMIVAQTSNRHLHTLTHIHTFTHIYTQTNTHTHTHTHKNKQTRTRTHTYTHSHTRKHAYTRLWPSRYTNIFLKWCTCRTFTLIMKLITYFKVFDVHEDNRIMDYSKKK